MCVKYLVFRHWNNHPHKTIYSRSRFQVWNNTLQCFPYIKNFNNRKKLAHHQQYSSCQYVFLNVLADPSSTIHLVERTKLHFPDVCMSHPHHGHSNLGIYLYSRQQLPAKRFPSCTNVIWVIDFPGLLSWTERTKMNRMNVFPETWVIYTPNTEPTPNRSLIVTHTHVPVSPEKLIAKEDPGEYSFINQGCLDVDGMDDKEEMRLTDVCRKHFA